MKKLNKHPIGDVKEFEDDYTKSNLNFVAHFFMDGNNYPVYKTTTGKYFIKKISPKTNKEYRFYLVF